MTNANQTNLAVGYGMAKGNDARETGANAARQAVSNLAGHPLSAVLVFASVRYDVAAVLQGIYSIVGDTPVLGATTAGEICCGPQQESVVVVALASPYLKVHVGVGRAISTDWQQAVTQATATPEIQPFFSPQDRTIWQALTRQGKSAFALLFSPGNTRRADSRSYEILEALKQLSAGLLPIVGGSAADDWHMENNYVLWGQQAYPDSLLVAVFETQLRFGAGLAHGFQPSSRRAAVTRAQGHEVLELDGQPAAEVYAGLLGTDQEALAGKHLTLTTRRPVGSPDPYGQYSLNVASYFSPEGGVRFSQPLPEGTTLTFMEVEPDKLIAAGPEALRKALLRGQMSDPALALVFSCALRVPLLGERQPEEIASLKALAPNSAVAGFYSFGEQGLADDGVNRHNNGVVTVLALGRELSYAAQVARENEQLRQELQESEARFRLMYDKAPLPYQSLDAAGCLLEVNQAWLDQLDYPRAEVIGRWFGDFLTPPSTELFRQRFAYFKKVGRVAAVEFEVIRRDGSCRLVSLDGAISTDRQGAFKQTHCVFVDITERRRMEKALRENIARLGALVENIQMGVLVEDEARRVLHVNQAFGDLFGIETPHLIVGADCGEAARAASALFADPAGFVQGVETRLAARATVIGDILALADGRVYERDYVPIEVNKVQHGSLWLYRDVTERIKAEQALQVMEQRYRNLFQAAPVFYIVTQDQDGRPVITDCNQTFLDVLGYRRAKVVGQPLADFYTPESRCHLLEEGGYRRALTGQLVTEERQLLAADGRIVQTMLHAAPEADASGQIVGTRAIFMDISEWAQTEEALRESERNFRAFFNTIDQLLFVLDDQGQILWTNDTVTRRLGYTETELHGQSVLMVHPPERRAEAGRIVQEMLAGQSDYCPVPVMTKDGRFIPVETRVIKGQWSGQEVIFGITKDLSALKASEEKFAKAFQSSPMLMAISELGSGRYVDVNETFLRTLGYQRHEVIGHTSKDVNLFVQPEQRTAALQQLQRQGYLRDYEVAIQTRSGEVRVGLFGAEYVQLQDQTMLLTVMNDITERQQMEQALRESEERLELFFTQSLDGFFFMMLAEPVRWDESVDKEAVLDYVFDHQRMTKVNRAILEQYGLTEAEMLGMTPRDFFAHDLALGRRVWREFFDRGQIHLDTDERRADGSQMWVEGDYICLYDQEGRIAGHFGIQRDITARVQAEAEREKLITELQSALAEIKTLRGIIPICASCKKIRDDEGYWHDVAVYIRNHSEAEFSHGICPDCARKLYPDIFKDEEQS